MKSVHGVICLALVTKVLSEKSLRCPVHIRKKRLFRSGAFSTLFIERERSPSRKLNESCAVSLVVPRRTTSATSSAVSAMASDADLGSERLPANGGPGKGSKDGAAGRGASQTFRAPSPLVDIGINITHRTFRTHWREVVRRAIDARVPVMVLTGTSIRSSEASLEVAREWATESGGTNNLFCTVGVHPHDAKDFEPKRGLSKKKETEKSDSKGTIEKMRDLLNNNLLAVAVGECGLDYNRNFSPKEDQLYAFREQVRLACDLSRPIFVHEREAHEDLVRVLDSIQADESVPPLPPIVVHCFTGNREEAQAYLDRGFYIGFTGTICKKERGAPLRELLPSVPLDRIMVETDAPFMGFVKGKRRHSEPAHVVGVAEEIARVQGVSVEEVCRVTTQNACRFFGIKLPSTS